MLVIRLICFSLLLFFTGIFSSIGGQQCRSVTTRIEVILSQPLESDSLQLFVFGNDYLEGLPTIPQSDVQFVAEPLVDGICSFEINLHANPHYYLIKDNQGSLVESEHIILPKNIITGGDDVVIRIGDKDIDFSGKGASKMARFHQLPTWYMHASSSAIKGFDVPAYSNKELEYVYRYFERSNQLSKLWLKSISDEREQYSDAEYQLLLAEGIGYIQHIPILATGVKALINKSFNSYEESQIVTLIGQKMIDLSGRVADATLAHSDNWIKFVDRWVSVDQKLKRGNALSQYEYLKSTFSAKIRDKLTTLYLIQSAKHSTGIDSLSQDFMKVTQNEYYRDLLSKLVYGRSKGLLAKDFSLFNQFDDVIKLSDFNGKVVFLDFWFPGCVPCIQYFGETISYAEEKFKDSHDVVFISVGILGDKEEWLKALQTNKYSSSTAINLFTGDAGWSHPIVSDYGITSAPTPMLIDKYGRMFCTNSGALGMGDRERLIGSIRECLTK